MKIVEIRAYPVSHGFPKDFSLRLGVGRVIKRDAVVVKVTTDDGIVGWGESHHGRAHTAVARLVETTLRQLVLGMDAADVVGVWQRIYRFQLASHGLGAATSIAMSGLDMALWDIRAKAAGWPLYRMLGGAPRPMRAYAGGGSLGFVEPQALVEEVARLVEVGYRAVKLRLGDSPRHDIARVEAVRAAFGDALEILTDANTGYGLAEARLVMPALERLGVLWLEEPFPAHDHRSYAEAKQLARVPLAAGENHYTRFEFNRLIEDRAITILQPDLSKCGGITEAARIAAMASAWKLPLHPHTSMTGINQAATLHLLCALENGGYFEGDASVYNQFRDELVPTPWRLDADGCVTPSQKPGIGVEVDEVFISRHPAIEGPSYV